MVDYFDDWDELGFWRKCWVSFFWIVLLIIGLVVWFFFVFLRTTPNRSGKRQWQ